MANLYRDYGKRVFDLLITIPLLLLLLPLFVLVAILIRLDSPGPILFIQERLGFKGRIFPVYKFRTMIDRSRQATSEIYGRHTELTRSGYWLRRFKIDELPQLLNVLMGDMSLVGPRPALPAQLADYNDDGLKRLQVRPGLTGLAQVRGNIFLTWPQRWQYDAYYVETISLWTDLTIILRTIAVVVLGESRFQQPPISSENKNDNKQK